MKIFWRVWTVVALVIVIIILATGFVDYLVGKMLLALFVSLSVSGLMKVIEGWRDKE